MDWYEHYEALVRAVARTDDCFGQHDWKGALRWLAKANVHHSEVTMAVIQRAHDEGMTKKAIAETFGFPASTLRGLRKTR